MNTEPQSWDEIAAMIHSDTSPVGIDARKTHILIIQMLQDLGRRIDRLEEKLESLQHQ